MPAKPATTPTTPDAITDVTGSHLTATDRRNIRALIGHPAFVEGQTFKAGGKVYTVRRLADADRWEVVTRNPEHLWDGRTVYSNDRSQFTARRPAAAA